MVTLRDSLGLAFGGLGIALVAEALLAGALACCLRLSHVKVNRLPGCSDGPARLTDRNLVIGAVVTAPNLGLWALGHHDPAPSIRHFGRLHSKRGASLVDQRAALYGRERLDVVEDSAGRREPAVQPKPEDDLAHNPGIVWSG